MKNLLLYERAGFAQNGAEDGMAQSGRLSVSLRSEWITYESYLSRLSTFTDVEMAIYHQQTWLSSIRDSFDASIIAIETYGEDNQRIAVTPFMMRNKGPFCLLGSPLSGMYTQFAGPLFINGLDIQSRKAALISQHKLSAHRAHYVEWGVRGGEDESEVVGRTLESIGHDYSARRTLVIDLSKGEMEVWNGFQTRARNMCRKAEKFGVVVCKATPDKVWIDNYYDMLRTTFERQGRRVSHPLSFFQRLITLTAEGRLLCLTADVNGRNVANAIFLIDRSRMLYLSGTANDEGMKCAANSLIQWEAMRSAICSGITEYDMGGLGVTSIDKFKLSFGGREINHHRWVYRSRLFKLAEPLALWAAHRGIIRISGS